MTLRQCLKDFLNDVEKLMKEDNLKNCLIDDDFKELVNASRQYRSGKTFPTTEGDKSVNSKKNRYKDILPFDYTRVPLTFKYDEKGEPIPGSDYINANFIKGIQNDEQQPAYIASQGPLPHTVPDFWRMIWEQKCQVIIMACLEIEATRHKCQCYWHKTVGAGLKFDEITVTVDQEVTHSSEQFLIRDLKVEFKDQTREIRQFHYLRWPDYGVASTDPILDLIAMARTFQPALYPPLLVHCSAGCGRTGTICSIDYAWNLLKIDVNNGHIMKPGFNVKEIVADMRKQRPSMVQAQDQYRLVHTTLKTLFTMYLDQIDKYIAEKEAENASEEEKDDPIQIYENIVIKKPDSEAELSYTQILINESVAILYEKMKSSIMPEPVPAEKCNGETSVTGSSTAGPPERPAKILDLKKPEKKRDQQRSTSMENGETHYPPTPGAKPKLVKTISNPSPSSNDNDTYAIISKTPPPFINKEKHMSSDDEDNEVPVVPSKRLTSQEIEECVRSSKVEPNCDEEKKDTMEGNGYSYASPLGNSYLFSAEARKAGEEYNQTSDDGAYSLPSINNKPRVENNPTGEENPYDYVSILPQGNLSHDIKTEDTDQYASIEEDRPVPQNHPRFNNNNKAKLLSQTLPNMNRFKDKSKKEKGKIEKGKEKKEGFLTKLGNKITTPSSSKPPVQAIIKPVPSGPATRKKQEPAEVKYNNTDIGFNHRVAMPKGPRENPVSNKSANSLPSPNIASGSQTLPISFNAKNNNSQPSLPTPIQRGTKPTQEHKMVTKF